MWDKREGRKRKDERPYIYIIVVKAGDKTWYYDEQSILPFRLLILFGSWDY